MAIFEVGDDSFMKIRETTFEKAGLKERYDLQRLLRSQVDIISPDTLVLSEEFCDWEDSRRSIDLLGLDKDANLVVIELKRTKDGGHMELQALRYAAMVSAMTFDKASEVFATHLAKMGDDKDASKAMLEFLGWDEPNEEDFGQDVRIVLVSADFSKELTTAVMWLNERDLDIRCVRMKPYDDSENGKSRVLVDVQQVLPLPEAAEYQVQIRAKAGKEREDRKTKTILEDLFFRFWAGLLDRAKSKTDLHANISPSKSAWVAATAKTVSGVTLNYCCFSHHRYRPRVELYIDTSSEKTNKAVFDQLHENREAIEAAFGRPLAWQRLDKKRACRIHCELEAGSVRDEANWQQLQEKMIDTMIRFEKAMRPALDALQVEKSN